MTHIEQYRKKARLILEIRYSPLVQAFDKRGKILEVIHPKFQKKMQHWRTQNVAVHMADNFDSPAKQISIDHLRTLIIYEDPGTVEEFKNDCRKLIKGLYEVFPDEISEIKRVGVRFISIFSLPGFSSFQDVFKKIQSVFYKDDINISLTIDDCLVSLKHDHGNIIVGPVKQKEPWIMDRFSLPEENVPNYGFGIDIDSFTAEIGKNDEARLEKIFMDTFQLTTATEMEVLNLLIVK